MRLCVPAEGDTLDAPVSVHFGRAACFIIIDTDTMKFEAVRNTLATPQRGGGAAAAQLLVDKGIEAVVIGRIGPEALNTLRLAYVQVYEEASGEDTVAAVVRKFKAGEYTETSFPLSGPWQTEIS